MLAALYDENACKFDRKTDKPRFYEHENQSIHHALPSSARRVCSPGAVARPAAPGPQDQAVGSRVACRAVPQHGLPPGKGRPWTRTGASAALPRRHLAEQHAS